MNKKLLRKNIKKIIPDIDISNPFIEKMIFLYIYQKMFFLEIDKTNFDSYFNQKDIKESLIKSQNILKELMNDNLRIENWDEYKINSIYEYYSFLITEIKKVGEFDKNLFLHMLNEQIKLIFLNQNIEKIKIFYDKNFDWRKYEKSVELKIFFYEKLKKCVELMKENYELDFGDNYFYLVNILKEN